MRKSVLTLTSCALLLGGLTACGGNAGNQAADTRYYDNSRPIGYYTSENNPYAPNRANNFGTKNVNTRGNQNVDQRGNAYRIGDNDGPLIEIMDRAVINGDRNANLTNPTVPLANEDRGMFGPNDNRYSRSDRNYHRHLDGTNVGARPSYYNNYNGALSEQLAERASTVRGVEDARAIIYGNDIMIAVEPQEGFSDAQVTRDVRRAVQPLIGNRDCRVVADQSTLNRMSQVDNDLRDGGPVERLNQDIRSMFDTITPGR
ncbi:YhcN/YlaJ family sporulation lipoprotein [Bacillus sp. FJAT-45066]|uniref:YhcN/YlaJ family sporulation lipoprotein n=1 Tax=Bacillus sp. FJAT-45066 TaxID=2011010 RepID=UPI001596EB58|nr:YhcN/YlaJ family sporulation lipoprotein [Bacillus sp. FJAT-45066]